MTIFSFISSVSRFILATLALFASRVGGLFILSMSAIECSVEQYLGRVYEEVMAFSNKLSDFFLKNRRIALIIFMAGIVGYCHGIYIKKEGGILDKTIPKEDMYAKYDEYVRNRVDSEGNRVEFEEFITVFIEFPEGISSGNDFTKILDWTEKAVKVFGKDSVLSIASYPDFFKKGDDISSELYISKRTLAKLDMDYWKSRVRIDPGVHGRLVGTDFGWAVIVIYLKPGYDEPGVFFTMKELAEEKTLSKLDRLIETDINPKDPHVWVGASWIIGRGTIYRILPIEMYTRIGGGIAGVFFIFWFIFQSFWQAVFATAMVGVAVVWTWGSIGLIDTYLGFPIRQRVYILAAFTNCIVQGVSFGLHKLGEFNRRGSWKGAQKVDMLIFNTACVAVFGFVTLWSFKVLSIRELGLLSALGVAYLYVLVTVFLPALGRFRPKRPGSTVLGAYYSSGIKFAVNGCSRLAKWNPVIYITVVIVLFVSAVWLVFVENKLIIGTTPLDFIPGTHAERSSEFLNAPGMPGADALNLLVEPALENEDGIYTEGFIYSLARFEEEITKRVREARMTSSVLGSVKKVSMEFDGTTLPTGDDKVGEIFTILETNEHISEGIISQQWFDGGVRVSVHAALNNSIKQGEFIREVMTVAEDFSDLKVTPFGKVPLYHREDTYIREGKPVNVVASQLVVIAFCFFIIVMKSRKLDSRRLSPWLGSLCMSIPFVFASSVMALIMVGFGIPLDVATAVITALAINAAIDFSVYFVDAYQEALLRYDKTEAISVAMGSEGEIIINDVLLNSVCFIPLMTSSFIPIMMLGKLMVVMIVSCGIGSLIIMPSMLRWAVRKEDLINENISSLGFDCTANAGQPRIA